MLETIGWIAAVLGISGAVFNNFKSNWCFVCWLVSNGLSGVIHYTQDIDSLLWRDAIFFGLAAWGFVLWKPQKKKSEVRSQN
jgi:nicotinamide riboside transporter PnuC